MLNKTEATNFWRGNIFGAYSGLPTNGIRQIYKRLKKYPLSAIIQVWWG